MKASREPNAQRALAHAEQVVDTALRAGASDAAVVVSEAQVTETEQRDGKLVKLEASDASSLSLRLFVDGRYSAHSTSDLRDEALTHFVKRAIAMTRMLDADPHRCLLDPKFYPTQPHDASGIDICDPERDKLDASWRREMAQSLEQATRNAGEDDIISCYGNCSARSGHNVRVHSNGFVGQTDFSQVNLSAVATMRDPTGRKATEAWGASVRHHQDLPPPSSIGKTAAERTRARFGQQAMDSGEMTLVVENRVAGRLLVQWLAALYGDALQQERSFLRDRLGKRVGSPHFALVDDPTLPRGLGSRLFDGEGYAARKRALVERGELRTCLLDSYYASKLGVEPTGGSPSNLVLEPGPDSPADLLRGVKRGVWVTGWLGGNSDRARGDFSLGMRGFAIQDGQVVGPVGELNVSGSHSTLWERLVAVGNDPWSWGSYRSPTLVFDGVTVSGR